MDRLVVTTTRAQLHMADKQDSKEEIVAVGPGADDDAQGAVVADDSRAGEDYQYPEGDSTDGDERVAGDEGDERTGHAEGSDDSGESGLTREQRRRRRKREKYDRDQRELNFLRSRNEQLEREHSRRLAAMESRQTQSDVLAIDGRIAQAESDVREAESLYTEALRSNNPEAATEALRVRDELRDGLRNLRGVKQQTVRTAQAQQTAPSQPQQDPAIAQRSREWLRENPWCNPKVDPESASIAAAVEQRVFQEGRLDPCSDEYWEEVDRRLAKRLPEHYSGRRAHEDEDDGDGSPHTGQRRPVNGTRKASGPTIKVGGRERTLRKGEVYIDEDRKAAMIEAGVWDDPKERQRFLESYQRYDRDAGRRPR